MSRFCVDVLLSHSAKKFRRGTRLIFRKFRVSKICMPERGKSRFSIENLLSHSTEKLRRGTLFSQNFWCRKKICLRWFGGGWAYHDFLSIFLSHIAEIFVGQPLIVSLISGIERFYASRSCVTILCRGLAVSQCQKVSSRNPSNFQKISGIENLYAWEGKITIFYRKFVVSQYWKTL